MASARHSKLDQLTKEDRAVLLRFGQLQNCGVRWKGRLRTAWDTGLYPRTEPDQRATLQALRNRLGVSWLSKFRFTQEDLAAPSAEPPWSGELETEYGLRAISYLSARDMPPIDGHSWPRDIIGLDGKSLIYFRRAGDANFDFDGWEVWHDGMFGGRRTSPRACLGWLRRAREIRAGTAKDFFGSLSHET